MGRTLDSTVRSYGAERFKAVARAHARDHPSPEERQVDSDECDKARLTSWGVENPQLES